MASGDAKRPNVLFILSDDQGCWALGCAGNREIITPNLDALAAEGMRFENFFCASPVCSPARATLLTGRMPSQHGIHDWLAAGDTTLKYEPAGNGQLIEYLEGQPGYTDCLAAAGYRCGISGKWHLGDSHHAQKSFRFWEVHAKGGGPYYHAPMIKDGAVYEEPRYVTDVITDNALQFLEDTKKDNAPFYLSVHYTAPHAPWQREQHPADVFDKYFDHCPFDSVPWQLPPPGWVRQLNMPVRDLTARRQYMSGYYAAVTAMDINIGRLLNRLETSRLRENTLIVFTSDNGMNMGHHGVFGKGNATAPLNMFEESVKVPFIVSLPGRVPGGVVNSAMLSQYDFMPTLLDYLDIKKPETEHGPGRSFARLLYGEYAPGHDFVVVYDEYGPVRMVRTLEWKYVHRYPDGPHELYNLTHDPGEQLNLAGQPEYAAKETEMRHWLDEWFTRYADHRRDGSHKCVSGFGQLGRCDPETKGERSFAGIPLRDTP